MLTIGKTQFHPDILEQYTIDHYAVRLPGFERPVLLRTGTTDQKVFRKIFVANDYAPKPEYRPGQVETIVDAGANIGCSTLWFRQAFPQARIIAIEPDPRNFAQLTANCGGLPGIELLQGALWGEDGELALQFEEAGKPLQSWGTRTVVASGAAQRTAAYSMDSVMRRFGLERIDYAKIDIEGGEKAVFEGASRGWIARTGLVVAEFHDRFLPGCAAAANAALQPRLQQKYRRGENWFFHLA